MADSPSDLEPNALAPCPYSQLSGVDCSFSRQRSARRFGRAKLHGLRPGPAASPSLFSNHAGSFSAGQAAADSAAEQLVFRPKTIAAGRSSSSGCAGDLELRESLYLATIPRF